MHINKSGDASCVPDETIVIASHRQMVTESSLSENIGGVHNAMILKAIAPY